jgi:hypothetical protein
VTRGGEEKGEEQTVPGTRFGHERRGCGLGNKSCFSMEVASLGGLI